MKVCIISNLFPPYVRGGAERVADRIARGLVDRGHEVTVISTTPENGRLIESQENGMQVFRFRPKNLYHVLEDRTKPFWQRIIWHLVDLFSSHGAKQVSDILQKTQPDLVITHNLKGIGLTIPRAIRKAKVPLIHLLHDVQLIIPSGMLIHGDEEHWMNKGFLQQQYESATRRALGSPDIVLSPSRFLLDFHLDRGFFKISARKVLPNPAPEFGITKRKISTGPLRLLFLGSLEEHKGLTWLVDTLRQSDLEFEFTAAGKGSLEGRVTSLSVIDQRFKLFGPFSKTEEAELLSTSDCLIVPSLCYENSPTVIYEAFSCGVPVVASNIGGIPELIEKGQNGYLFEPGNGQDLIKQLRRIKRAREDWYDRQDEIRMNVSRLGMTHYLDQLEQIMRDVLK